MGSCLMILTSSSRLARGLLSLDAMVQKKEGITCGPSVFWELWAYLRAERFLGNNPGGELHCPSDKREIASRFKSRRLTSRAWSRCTAR